jgi:hypothetical protein
MLRVLAQDITLSGSAVLLEAGGANPVYFIGIKYITAC